MKVLQEDNPKLRQKSLPFIFLEDNAIKLAVTLKEVASYNSALGLSSPQIDVFVRAFVFTQEGNYKVAFNPQIVGKSEETVIADEGCLSYPSLFIKLKRHKEIVVTYQDYNDKLVVDTLTDYDARCFEHELDHLDGILFLDKLSPLKRKMAKKKWAKIKK